MFFPHTLLSMPDIFISPCLKGEIQNKGVNCYIVTVCIQSCVRCLFMYVPDSIVAFSLVSFAKGFTT